MHASQRLSDAPRIERFDIIHRIGRGSQGSVYLAHDPNLDRRVAIKVIDSDVPELAEAQSGESPLEGRISGRLRHPNIVAIHDAGVCDDGTYMVFEYVEGTTLRDVLDRDGAWPIEKAAPVLLKILEAVTEAHRCQIVHLDLNLRNILLDDEGEPRVMDFGLSQHVENAPRDLTTATGTLRYMAPEHFNGGALGPYTDVFALGSSFYELVTGRPAMDGHSIVDVMKQIQSGVVEYEPLNALPYGADFAQFLRGALHANVDGRYADGAAMLAAFRTFMHDNELTQQPGGARHSTIDFLLRRMQRKKDFPSISKTLIDINRLTGDGSGASADKLAQVVLRDFALTNKILKLVNSAFYGNRSAEVSSISQAIVIMGVDRLRMIANSLTLFGHLRGDGACAELKDSMIRSLLAGMLARHLAKALEIKRAEEAFILGMFEPLGENLCIYYFRDEYEDVIEAMKHGNVKMDDAARSVLGVTMHELGTAVAKIWQLPDAIIDVIKGVPDGTRPAPDNVDEQLRDIAIFCARVCALNQLANPDEKDQALAQLLTEFRAALPIRVDVMKKLLAAGFDKLTESAAVFEIDPASSPYCAEYLKWLQADTVNNATVMQPVTNPPSDR